MKLKSQEPIYVRIGNHPSTAKLGKISQWDNNVNIRFRHNNAICLKYKHFGISLHETSQYFVERTFQDTSKGCSELFWGVSKATDRRWSTNNFTIAKTASLVVNICLQVPSTRYVQLVSDHQLLFAFFTIAHKVNTRAIIEKRNLIVKSYC